MIFPKKVLPGWIVFLFDLFICLCSFFIALSLRFNFKIPLSELVNLPVMMLSIAIVRAGGFLIGNTYSGMVRHTNTSDVINISKTVVIGSLVLAAANFFSYYYINGRYIIPFSVILIEMITSVFLLTTYRVLVKATYIDFIGLNQSTANVLIYGAGEAGIIAKKALDRDAGIRYKVLAFLDDDPRKARKKLEGSPIFSGKELSMLLKKNNIDHLIIAVQSISKLKKQEIIETGLAYGVKVLNVPPVQSWTKGELSYNQIREINIEDLLDRDEIVINEGRIAEMMEGKTVLITGGAGSIGSELVRQIARFPVSMIVVVDQGETPMFHLDLELSHNYPDVSFELILADISQPKRMQSIFEKYKPQMVFHAAAYKHVPVMEKNPFEAVTTNIFGTKLIADLAVAFQSEVFVMVSTDKAVNPTNVMGASKRIAEIYTQSLNSLKKTRFITTRFGNVLGSNGSVIPLFKSQIEKGGPLTVTHPEITRFFMTIPEACRLVLEAGAMGAGGEIFVFDMGVSVKIVDLAKKMIQLSGLTLGRDIEIVFTGLRPGEKLYEELLSNQENTIPTHHSKILIARVPGADREAIVKQLDILKEIVNNGNEFELVCKMKDIVPEFISQNSVFEQLDNRKLS